MQEPGLFVAILDPRQGLGRCCCLGVGSACSDTSSGTLQAALRSLRNAEGCGHIRKQP